MQLGIDAGATRTKWSLAAGSQVLARGEAPPLTGHLFTPEQIQHTAARLRELRLLVQATVPDLAVQRVVAGITGLERNDRAADTMRELLAEVFMLPRPSAEVCSDLELTFRAYHAPGEGVLLYAGTGSIAYHLDQRGRIIRAGGYGYLLADEGGALWLAREALGQVLREQDEGGHIPSILAERLKAAVGSLDWPALRAFTYGQDRSLLAALAPQVTAAALEGDAAAQHIVARGASELARLARCVALHLPRGSTITVTGGAITPAVYALLAQHLGHAGLTTRPGNQRISDVSATRWPGAATLT
jgi:N-acetylglucosamine kinase-like BadF-type ATPase